MENLMAKKLFLQRIEAKQSSSQMIVGGDLPSKEKPDIYFSNYGFGWFLGSYRGHYRV